MALVRSVQSLWRSAACPDLFARAMTLGDRLLATMDSHPVLLLALSEHESYGSLFYAVLQSLIKVCHRHWIFFFFCFLLLPVQLLNLSRC